MYEQAPSRHKGVAATKAIPSREQITSERYYQNYKRVPESWQDAASGWCRHKNGANTIVKNFFDGRTTTKQHNGYPSGDTATTTTPSQSLIRAQARAMPSPERRRH